ncbi:GNAT family N-acetyltransferase [Streptomyces coeruleorubidus]|uniref:GNAT family N-acetyltransferase n=1 Tax=Streptomyces coeruleorubidus TaxID=116188 RepID=UPI00237F50B8|nr:GNAT family N-acetyltransferase [Streptomyces coeruleorubidus]WDV50225.1 GNAT family N-acetyltransferase [Streptomyces coeruleorubidus]
MTVPNSPEFLQITRPHEITPDLRRQLVGCWEAVINAGGAVIAPGIPLPPVSVRDVAPAAERLIAGLDPERGRLLVATVDGALAGWLIIRRDLHPLVAHCGVVNHVQTHPHFRRRGIGTALMTRVREIAVEDMKLERLQLSAREGLGLEHFYRSLGWTEVGRWPGALRVAPGDDRDDILMSLTL